MTTSAGPRDLRRTAAGLGLIGAPVLMLLSAVVARSARPVACRSATRDG